MTTTTYIPVPGDQVRVRRYEVPVPELAGTSERRLTLEVTGAVATAREVAGGYLLTLEGDGEPIFTGSQFSGQDPDHGCSWTLQTEVVPLAEVAQHDQAELDARAEQAGREHARALALHEEAQRAEVVARQRLTGAQQRLKAALEAARPASGDLGRLSETRKADRAVMAQNVARLARSYGLDAAVTVDEAMRQAYAELSGPHGLRLTVRFRGRSPQSKPDTYVLSWHIFPDADEGYRLSPAAFTDVNPYHGTRATDVAYDFNALVTKLGLRFAAIADGSAFIAP